MSNKPFGFIVVPQGDVFFTTSDDTARNYKIGYDSTHAGPALIIPMSDFCERWGAPFCTCVFCEARDVLKKPPHEKPVST